MLSYIWTALVAGFQVAKSYLPELVKVRTVGRRVGLFGIIASLIYALVQAVVERNAMLFVNELAYSLYAVDSGISAHVSTLTSSSSLGGMEFLWIMLGIYSKLWLLSFITGFVAGFFEDWFVGDNAPDKALYVGVFLFVVTPLEFVGVIIGRFIENGKLTEIPMVWHGLVDLATNVDVVAAHAKTHILSLPGVSEESLGGGTDMLKDALNQSGNVSNSTGGNSSGVQVI